MGSLCSFFNTAGVASIAYIFATYTEYFVKLPHLSADAEKIVHLFIPGIGTIYPFENLGVKTLTILVIAGLTLINYRSTVPAENCKSYSPR